MILEMSYSEMRRMVQHYVDNVLFRESPGTVLEASFQPREGKSPRFVVSISEALAQQISLPGGQLHPKETG